MRLILAKVCHVSKIEAGFESFGLYTVPSWNFSLAKRWYNFVVDNLTPFSLVSIFYFL